MIIQRMQRKPALRTDIQIIGDAFERIENIRFLLANSNIAVSDTVTCSIGLAMHPNHGQTVQTLYKSADTALYQAKNNGKNPAVCIGEGVILPKRLKSFREITIKYQEYFFTEVHYNMSSTTNHKPQFTQVRIREIDLLRFIAAIAVVIFHYAFRGYAANDMTTMPYPLLSRYAKFGYLGVNLFFMISGFVILMTASEGSLKKFIVSRFVRLYPTFWLCCSVTFIMTLLLGGERYSATIHQYLINLTMFSEYFHVQPIDGSYWSLFIELKFYILIAIILIIKKIDWIQFFLILWLLATIYLEYFIQNDYWYYWLNVNYSVYFIAGATFFLIRSKGVSFLRIITLSTTWIIACLQAFEDTLLREKYYKTPMNENIVLMIITLFYLTLFLIALNKTNIIGQINWTLLGGLTYPLYLLHQHIGFMIFNAIYPKLNEHIIFWGVIILILIMSYLVNQFEKKILSPTKELLDNFFDFWKSKLNYLSS